MKTIREYLQELPIEIRHKALQNAHVDIDVSEDGIESAIDAIYGAFIWESSPEGTAYWSGICNELSQKTKNNG